MELSTEEGKRLIDQIAALQVPVFVLTGGDPIKRPDLFELIAHARQAGVRVSLTPSATPLLTREVIFRLKEAGLARLAVSMDGARAETHDAFRGMAGSFARTLDAIRWANEAELPVQINTTFSRRNIGEIDDLVARIAEHFRGVRVGPALGDPDLGPLISGPQRDRVVSFVSESGRGGDLLTGGEPLTGGGYGNGYFYAPTLIDNVTPDQRIFHEEVFGPVLAVTTFASHDEAVELANGTDYGLVTGVWTTNVSTAQRMIRDIKAGQVFVNTYGASGGVELPFGGFKQSGYGREKGAEGLRGFAQVKTAIIAS